VKSFLAYKDLLQIKASWLQYVLLPDQLISIHLQMKPRLLFNPRLLLAYYEYMIQLLFPLLREYCSVYSSHLS